jgi:hypothetical protein
MKRKPDLMWILAIIFGLGVVTTGYTQSLWERSAADNSASAYEARTMLVPHTKPDQ